MTDRNATIEAFLHVNGQGRALREKLAGDASARRYERLTGGPTPAILMDAPPDQPALRTVPFVQIASWLRRHGFSAPDIVAQRLDDGLVLMEDLGDDLFSRVLAAGADGVDETDLYAAAVDVLVALQALDPPADLPPYDDDKMLEEVGRLTRWAANGLSTCEKDAYLDIWRDLLPCMRVGSGGLRLCRLSRRQSALAAEARRALPALGSWISRTGGLVLAPTTLSRCWRTRAAM